MESRELRVECGESGVWKELSLKTNFWLSAVDFCTISVVLANKNFGLPCKMPKNATNERFSDTVTLATLG